MSHISGYMVFDTEEKLNNVIDKIIYGTYIIGQYNEKGTNKVSGYKINDGVSSKISGLKTRYGKNA